MLFSFLNHNPVLNKIDQISLEKKFDFWEEKL